MKPLASELLHDLKKTANFWKVVAIVSLTVALVELAIIIF